MNPVLVKRITTRSTRIFLLITAAALSFSAALYIRSEWYNFQPRKPFSGNTFYNPYSEVKEQRGMLCNFHAHSNQWNGVTNGHGTNGDVMKKYHQLGYEFSCISNYHAVDCANDLKCYEHGWGVSKTHQLVLGAKQITWLDFPLLQNEHQQQFLINYLKESNENALVVLAHPSLRNAYSEQDLQKISGYHLFEAINKLRKSLHSWDIALSSGNPSFILGSDDCHNFNKPNDIGRCGTYVFTSNPNSDAIKSALKSGRSMAIEFGGSPDGSINEKRMNVQSVTKFTDISCTEGTISIAFPKAINELIIIGDHSDTLFKKTNENNFIYTIPAQYSYARIEYIDQNESHVYLNPFIRSDNGQLPHVYPPTKNDAKTTSYRFLIAFLISGFWIFIIRTQYVRSRKKLPRNAAGTYYPAPSFYRTPRVDGTRTRVRYR